VTLILNLGCGTKVSNDPDVVNVDWSPYLRISQNPIARRLGSIALDDERAQRLAAMPRNIKLYNLRRGIPWPDASVDAVYHSHLFEHLDRDVAPAFQREIRRVLRPGGIQRVVVPDLERLCRAVVKDLDDGGDPRRHDALVAELIEQCTRREAFGTAHKRPLRRRLENIVLGDARKRGETHQWMYDSANLTWLLEEVGFIEPRVVNFDQSRIPRWREYGLDENSDGTPYKPGSLYLEAVAPYASK
jgi:SAM-dependent methyltransferase